MKRWLGVLCLAAVCGLIGLIEPEPGEIALYAVRDGARALAFLLAAIGLIGLARELMRSERAQQPPRA